MLVTKCPFFRLQVCGGWKPVRCQAAGLDLRKQMPPGCNAQGAARNSSEESNKMCIQGCFNTPLEHTPKPLPTGYEGIPFIDG